MKSYLQYQIALNPSPAYMGAPRPRRIWARRIAMVGFLLIATLVVLGFSISKSQGQQDTKWTWTTTPTTIVEGDDINLTLNVPTSPTNDVIAYLGYSLTSGGSPRGLPFLADPPNSVTISAGQTSGSIAIPTVSDGKINAPDTFFVSVIHVEATNPDSYTDDDRPDPQEFVINNSDQAQILLGGFTGMVHNEDELLPHRSQPIHVILDTTVETELSVTWSITPGSGVTPEDFNVTGENPLVFAANSPPNTQKSITLEWLDDTLVEGREEIDIGLASFTLADTTVPADDISHSSQPERIHVAASDQPGDIDRNARRLHSCQTYTIIPASDPVSMGLECWGDNTYGQLGDGTTTSSFTPVKVKSTDGTGFLEGVAEFSTGFQHTCARVAGDVFCWGRNNHFQLGQLDQSSHSLPIRVPLGPEDSRAIINQFSAGGFHNCARANHHLWCWGLNTEGQAVGYEGCIDICRPRYMLPPFDKPYPGRRTRGLNHIYAGGFHSCEGYNDGFRCFGRGGEGQLGYSGYGNYNNRNNNVARKVEQSTSLIQPRSLSVGAKHTCGLGANGEVLCWGSNQYGQLGAGTIGQRQPNPGNAEPVNDNLATQLNSGNNAGTAKISGAKAVSAGDGHTCIITSDDRVRCWGRNDYGQLGVDTLNDGSSDLDTPYTSINVAQEAVTPVGTVITRVEASSFHTCAWSATERLCWGLNAHGSLGEGVYRRFSSSPARVPGITGASAIVGGAAHSCAVVGTERTVSCWGNNSKAQLGRGSDLSSTITPVQPQVGRTLSSTSTSMATTTTTMVNIDHVSAISSGPNGLHTCAVVNDTANSINDVVCWGANDNHKARPTLDPNANIHRLHGEVSPLIIDWNVSTETITDVAVGDSHTCVLVAIDSGNDEVRCWGGNDAQQVGVSELTVADDPATTDVDERMFQDLEATVARPKTYVVPPTSTNHATDPLRSAGEIDTPTMLAAGSFTTCALADEHSYRIQTDTDGFTPVTVPRGSEQSTVATTPPGDGVAGEVICWGDIMVDPDFSLSGWQQVSLRNRSNYYDPCLPSDDVCTRIDTGLPEEVAATVLTNLTSVAVGTKHACAVQSTAGEVFCWGNNDYGQLAYDLSGQSSRFAHKVLVYDGQRDQDDNTFLTNVGEIAAGMHHTCALIDNANQPDDGDVYCWGNNDFGQLGNPRVGDLWLDRAVKVEGLPGPALTLGAGSDHTCAIIEADGAIYCWGDNSLGKTGNTGIISGADDDVPTAAFEFALPSAGVSFERSVWQQVQMPSVLGGDTEDLTYQIVQVVSGQEEDQPFAFPAGLIFQADTRTIEGSPAYGLAAPVELKYQALNSSDQSLVTEVTFTLNITGATAGQAPTIASPISESYLEGNDFLLVTESDSHTVDLTQVFTDPQTSVFCTTTVTTGCVSFAHTSTNPAVAAVTIDPATNIATIAKGTAKGDTNITFTATDPDSNATSDSVTVRYNTPPILSANYRDSLPAEIHYDHNVADLDLALGDVFSDAETDLLAVTFAYTSSETPPTTRTVYEPPDGWRLLTNSSNLGGPHDLQICATDTSGTKQQVCAETQLHIVEPLTIDWETPTTQTEIDGETVTVGFLEFTEGLSASIQLPAATGGVGDITYTLTELTGFTFDPADRALSSSAATRFLPTTDGQFTYTAMDSRSYRNGEDCSTDQSCAQITGVATTTESVTGFTFDDSQPHISAKAGQPVNIVLPQASKTNATVTYCFSIEPTCPDTIPGTTTHRDGLSFDPATRTIAGFPNAGTPNTHVVLFASDENDLITLPFSYQISENRPPTILTHALTVGPSDSPAAYDFTATENIFDPDDTMFTCIITKDPADTTNNIAFTPDATTGCNPTFGPGPDGLGSDSFVVEITDAAGDPTTATFTVTNNTPPAIVSGAIPDEQNPGRYISQDPYTIDDVKALFADPDPGETLTPTVTVISPTTAAINLDPITHTLTVTAPTVAQTYSIRICVTDSLGAQTCDTLEIDWLVNRAPDILIDDLDQDQLTVTTDGSLVIDLNQSTYVNEPDGDEIDCTLTRKPNDAVANLGVQQNNCSLTFTTNAQNVWGPDTFELLVDDRNNPPVTADFTVYHNNPPQLAEDAKLRIGRKFDSGDYTNNDISTLFTDPDLDDGDTITITKGTVTPPNLQHTYDPVTHMLTITVPTDNNMPITHTIEFCAEDIATITFCETLTVAWATNNLPDIKFDNPGQTPQVVQTGGPDLVLDLTDPQYVEDIDTGDTVTCNSVTPVSPADPPHITHSLTDCDLTFRAGTGGFGSAEFTLEVTDGTTPVTGTIVVWQSAVPTIVETEFATNTDPRAITIKTSDDPLDIDLVPKFTETDTADTLTYSLEMPNPPTLNAVLVAPDNNMLRIAPPASPGMGSIEVCATDRSFQEACGTLNFQFVDNQAPTLVAGVTAPFAESVIQGKTINLRVTDFYEDTDNPAADLFWEVTLISGDTNLDDTDTDIATVTVDTTDMGLLTIEGVGAGSTVFHLTATDGITPAENQRLEITVTPNTPPTLISRIMTPIEISVGIGSRFLDVTDYFVDTDTPEDLRWEVTPISGDTNLDDTDTNTATASVNTGDPQQLDVGGVAVGSTSYHVRATDGTTATADVVMTITVVTNNTPTLLTTRTPPLRVSLVHSTTETWTVTDYFADSDTTDTLSWVVNQITNDATLPDTDADIATVTVDAADDTMLEIDGVAAGTTSYHIAAFDELVNSDNVQLEVTVTNAAPTLENGTAANPITIPIVQNETRQLNVGDYYTDTDNTDEQLSWSLTTTDQTDTAVATAIVNANNSGQIDIEALTPGTSEYELTVTDGTNTTPSQRLVITVTAPTPPPSGGGSPGGNFPGGGIPGGGTPGGGTPGGGTTQPAPPAGDGRFSDDDGNTHEANINLLAEMGISRGCNPPANTNFCPNRAVTRGEMATFMVRAFDLTEASGNLFSDDNGNTHEANINRLATAEITRGCNPPENSRYCPERAVTRAQMATFIARALSLAEGSGEFTDTADSVHANDINRIATVGITRGCNPPTNSRYCPERAVTRAEMATFLIRATDLEAS